MVEEGETAPDFTLPNQHGDSITLSELRGSPVVLYFFPRADTAGCTTQACGIRDRGPEYAKAGARVLGVSPDTVEAEKKFADKHGLEFDLLADADHEIADLYGVWGERKAYGKTWMGVTRSTFIIDPDGEVARVFPKVSPKTHDDVVLDALAELSAAA
jgi:thioredoxin-dependent peroxiredoxin